MTRLAAAVPLAVAALLALPSPVLAAWAWPVQGEVITGFRNGDDPYAAGQHRGIDIAGEVGARVVAAAPGLVRFAGTAGSSGVTASVRTDDGSLDLSYLHLASLAVRRGQRVAAGQAIGTVGVSGVRSAGPAHLHFGVRRAGDRHAYLDPLTMLPPPGAPAPAPRTPDAVPVAAPVPVRPVPAPTPVAPRLRVPVRRPAPLPAPRRPLPAPIRTPEPRRVVLGRRIAAPVARPAQPTAEPRARPAPTGGEPASLGAAPSAGHHAPASERRATPAAGDRGPDLGWIAACAGLLGAALALSPGARGRGTRLSVPPRLAALLPALAGRGARTRQ